MDAWDPASIGVAVGRPPTFGRRLAARCAAPLGPGKAASPQPASRRLSARGTAAERWSVSYA